MKLGNAVENTAILSNVDNLGEFRIKNSAKAFNILSSSLYSNKIRAIVRELGCNAYDSHIAAGKKEIPFEIHLPNNYEPWFHVRDFGVGLDHDQVTNIYTTYFESTKSDSNDFVGALGLGSKSPFSYTENFTVTAIKDGVKRVYTAFINEIGIPSIALMATIETDEINGVEVRFSVNEHLDFGRFSNETSTVFTHFETKPNIIGKNGFSFAQTSSYIKVLDDVYGKSGYYNSSSSVVMGNIEYPIDISIMSKSCSDLSIIEILKCDLLMYFEIGELDIQPSREGLSYIKSTIDAIIEKAEKVRANVLSDFTKEMNNNSTYYEKIIYVNSILNDAKTPRIIKACISNLTNYPPTSVFVPKLVSDIKEINKIIEYGIPVQKTNNPQNVYIEYTSFSYDDLRPRKKIRIDDIKPIHKNNNFNYQKYNFIKEEFYGCINISSNPIFVVIDDDGRNYQSKIRYLSYNIKKRMKWGYSSSVYILRKSDDNKTSDFEKFIKDHLLGAENIKEPIIFYTSKLEIIPREKKEKKALVREEKKYLVLNMDNTTNKSYNEPKLFTMEEMNKTGKEIYYAKRFRNDIHESEYFNKVSRASLYDTLENVGFDGLVAYVDPRERAAIEKKGEWKYIDTIIDEFKAKVDIKAKNLMYIVQDPYDPKLNSINDIVKLYKIVNALPSNSKFRMTVENTLPSEYDCIKYHKLVMNLHVNNLFDLKDFHINNLYDKIFNKYKIVEIMMKYNHYISFDDILIDIIDYINLVESN